VTGFGRNLLNYVRPTTVTSQNESLFDLPLVASLFSCPTMYCTRSRSTIVKTASCFLQDPLQAHFSVCFPALATASSTPSGVSAASSAICTVTFCVSRLTSKEATPCNLPKMRVTAPEHPSHVIATRSSTVSPPIIIISHFDQQKHENPHRRASSKTFCLPDAPGRSEPARYSTREPELEPEL